jgi:spectrin beta, non-erythrocytic 1/4/5
MSKSGDWIKLQRKIFSRWVNQKLSVVNIPVEDALESFKSGVILIKLMEVLSEKECTEKYNKAPKMRIQQVDTASKALKFVFGRDAKSCGVNMKNPPSPDNIVDGLERPVLGMLWAIMLKYMRFSDDEGRHQVLVCFCFFLGVGYDVCFA